MTAPTVPTAPLPSLTNFVGSGAVNMPADTSRETIDYLLRHFLSSTLDCRLRILVCEGEQRKNVDIGDLIRDLDAERTTLTEQLAASERTCAELEKEVIDVRLKLAFAEEREETFDRLLDRNCELRARAEAAELKNNPTKE